jgi:S1-C subfamily serine protease
MKHRRTFGVAALVAGVVVLDGGALLRAVEVSPAAGQQVYAAMAAETHRSQGYIGVEMRDLSEDQLASFKLKDAHGVEITNLDHDGPACKAGMKLHDVILQMNGQAVDSGDQLRRLLRDVPVGRTLSFVVSRDGLTQTLTLTTADRRTVEQQAWNQHYSVPAPVRGSSFLDSSKPVNANGPQKEHKDLLGTETIVLSASFTGAKLEVMGSQLAEFFGAADGAGLLVRSVDENSPADEAGLKAGDVVVRINSLTVSNATSWTKTVHDYRGKPVPVVVLRDKHEQTLTLKPDGKKRSSLWPSLGLEGFFDKTTQQTKVLLAKL